MTITHNEKTTGRVFARFVAGVWIVAALMLAWSADSVAQVKVTHKISEAEGNLTRLLEAGDEFGGAVARIGDLDGDGLEDIAVGAAMDDDPGINHGTVWILFLDNDGNVKQRQKIGSAAGGFTGVLDQDDYFGISVAGLGDLDGDGVEDIVVGADRDDDACPGPTGDRGAVWIIFLNDDGTVKAHQKISQLEGGFGCALDPGGRFGCSVASLGDLDGDLVTDIAVGAFHDDDGGTGAGAVWIIFLNTDGTVKGCEKISATSGGFGGVVDAGDHFGCSVAGLQDLDGEGPSDAAIVVGAEGDDDGATDAGAVWVLFLDTSGAVLSEQKISATTGAVGGGGLSGLGDDDRFGTAVSTRGSWSEMRIMVGTPNDGDGGPYRGAVWFLNLESDGTFYAFEKISDTQSNFTGVLDDNDYFGRSVAWGPDIDGNGYDDVFVGATGDDDGSGSGAVWIALLTDYGDDQLEVVGEQKISQTQGEFAVLLDNLAGFGESIARVGDLDGDGVDEFAVGAPGSGAPGDYGSVWILFLSDAGTVEAFQKIGQNTGGFTGALSAWEKFGWSVAGLGDLDSDGVEDIAVGAPMDSTGGPNRGAVYILFLRNDGTVKGQYKIATLTGGFESPLADGDGFGYSVAGLGDLDDDGRYELAVGATGDDGGGTDRGAVWILSLAPSGLEVDSAQKISDTEGGFLGDLGDGDAFGASVAAIGDLDSDGVPDMAVGAVGDDDGFIDAGAVWLVYLQADRTVQTEKKLSTDTYFKGLLDAGDAFGYSVASIGDADGDGFEDIAIGAAGDDDGVADAGAVWIAFLDGTGVVKTHGKLGYMQGNFVGVLETGDYFGSAVCAAGDIDLDGTMDLMVGHSGEDDGGDGLGAIWPLKLAVPDEDGDGVYYVGDLCPDTDASFFDRNGDGCVDDYSGARHVEFWGQEDSLLYYVHMDGAPGISDGSDFTAILNAVDKWTDIVGVDVDAHYGGTVDWSAAAAGDGDNFVTFSDDEYDFGMHTLAVGVATSFDVPTFHNGRFYRAGQIVDADMIFNPAKSFKTSSAGSGVDLESVATHEAGHLFGISHSAAVSSIMFYALQGGEAGRVPKVEDVTIAQKAYPDPSWMNTTRRIYGNVKDRFGQPVPGAIVFMTDTDIGDTLGCDMTLPDGSYKFIVPTPWSSVRLSIYPIDGTSAIGYLQPAYVNFLVDSTAVTLFPPEYYNAGDSYDEDPLLVDSIEVPGAGLYGPCDFVLNEDTSPPAVVTHSPANAAVGVRADAAVVIEFSEAIDPNSVSGNFRLFNETTLSGTAGNAFVTSDGTLLGFTPTGPLDYSTSYICSLKTGIEDLYGNPLSAVYSFQFTTQDEPPLSLASLVPNKGAAGSIVVVNGGGFDATPAGNIVHFTDSTGAGAVAASVLSASPTQLIVSVPGAAGTGDVSVDVGPFNSNPVSFTVLSSSGVPRGFEAGSAALGAVPRAVTLAPDGDIAWVATSGGAVKINADPKSASFLDQTAIAIGGGLNDLAVAPDGSWVFAVSEMDSAIYVIDPLSATVIDQLEVFAGPRGFVVAPSGHRAYVPTNAGEIQIWDINEASATNRRPIGSLSAAGFNVKGKAAIDPSGDYLLALTTSGKLLAYDLGPDTLLTSVTTGLDPRDVAVDPAAQRAYVSDGTGLVSIVSLSGFFKILDVATSGSLRGIAMSPSGEYLYAANRQLNFLDVIDLVETSPSYRSVATMIPTGVNPVDVGISPDGGYAYTLVEDSQTLVVTGIGVGPVIRTLSRRAGPPGTKLVAAGEGFGTNPADLVVKYVPSSGPVVLSGPERTTGRAVSLTVPPSAGAGPMTITITKSGTPDEVSNTVSFEVLSDLGDKQLDPVMQSQLLPGVGLAAAARMSPLGDQFVVGTEDGKIVLIDVEANSPTFNQVVGTASLGASPVHDIEVRPDGKRAYASVPSDQAVRIIDLDKSSATYGTMVGSVSFGGFAVDTPQEIAVSPDGELLLVQDIASNLLYYVPILPGVSSENQVIDTRGVTVASEIIFNNAGTHAYMTLPVDKAVSTVCVDSASSDFWTETSRVSLALFDPVLTPLSLSMSPKGDRCVVLGKEDATTKMYLVLFDTSNPDTTIFMLAYTYEDVPPPPAVSGGERIDIGVGGDRLVYHQNGIGTASVELADWGFGSRYVVATPFTRESRMDHDFTVDGDNLYAVGTFGDSLQVYAYTMTEEMVRDTLFAVSGDGQTGVAGLALASPLRVRVWNGSEGATDIPVTFEVSTGGGVFAGTETTTQIVRPDRNGYAEVSWKLGAGAGAQTVSVTAAVLEGSPLTFAATAVLDPNSLPLELVSVQPAGAFDVAPTTTVVAAFSRPVLPSSITNTTFFFHKAGETTPVAGKTGFADNNRTVSVSPSAPLDFSASYTLEITGAVQDQSLGNLTNPGTFSFTTKSAPPLQLASVSPPSGTVGITIILGGVSFNPEASANEVFFGTQPATPSESSFDYVKVVVPPGAETGTLRVYNGADTSNALLFTVLVESNVASDEVVATANTGATTKTLTINPDGSMAYAVSPDGDVVIPIDMDTKTSLPGISVGDHPISIAAHPEGSYVYVPNFNSNTVSVIGIDETNPAEYHQVVASPTVGNFPIDVAVHPDGSHIYVVNAGSDYDNNIDIIDGDDQSANHNTVVARGGTGSTSKTITINPDGSLLYVGTDDGYVVLNSGDESYSVVARGGQGSTAKTLTINPDGSLLFFLTSDGNVLVFDITPGSANENTLVATVQGSSTTKEIALSPDGAILYLIQEENDVINVVGIEIQGAIGVIERGREDAVTPPFTVVTTPLGSIFAGEDPEMLVFDPTGSGRAVVSNSGPKTVTFLEPGFVALEFPPDSITVPPYAVVPSIDLAGFEMKNTTIGNLSYAYTISTTGPCTLSPGTFASANGGATRETSALSGFLNASPAAYSEISGTTPMLAPGDSFAPPPAVLNIPAIREHTEQVITYKISPANVPNLVKTGTVRVLIDAPVPVFVQSFFAEALDEGVRLAWDISADEAISGYRVYRALSGGVAEIANLSGLIPPGDKEWIDAGAEGGMEYAYTLGVVLSDGGEALSQTVTVRTKALVLSLNQNYPNPFNPTTTISFTIPNKQHVTLTVYNVAGQCVATLVDEEMTAGRKEIGWDGRNTRGDGVSTGVYFYRLQTGGKALTRKMVLLK